MEGRIHTRILPSTALSPSNKLTMFSKTFLALVVLAASVATAVPSVRKRATCTNGKTTANDAVRSIPTIPSIHALEADDREKCCVWFDVLDDIQENL